MKTSINIILAALLMVATTLAATITHTTTILPSFTDWNVTNAIPQFDPSLGTLTNVSIGIGANVATVTKVESKSTLTRSVTSGSHATVTATIESYSASASVTNSHSQQLGRFDGVVDFGGTSGYTVGIVGSAFGQVGPADFIPFIGVGNIPLITSAAARGFYRGPADYEQEVSTTASAIVTVTYEFSPPVCPSCDPEPEDCDDRNDRRKPRNRRR